MFPLTEPPAESGPAPRSDAPPTAEYLGGINSALVVATPFLDLWLEAVASDGSLPSDAPEVASVMARSVGVGRVAFTDWQRINAALRRHRRDLSVLETMSELSLEGYIDRNIDDRFGRNYGWSLHIPEGDL